MVIVIRDALGCGTSLVEDVEPLIGAASVGRILAKADRLRDFHLANNIGGAVTRVVTLLRDENRCTEMNRMARASVRAVSETRLMEEWLDLVG